MQYVITIASKHKTIVRERKLKRLMVVVNTDNIYLIFIFININDTTFFETRKQYILSEYIVFCLM